MILNAYSMICGMYIYSDVNDLFRKSYNDGYTYEQKAALEDYVQGLMKSGAPPNTKGWFLERIKGGSFLFRISGIKGTYVVCIISLDSIKSLQNANTQKQGFVLYSSLAGEPLTMADKVKAEGITLKGQSDSYYISGTKNKYFIVQEKLSYTGFNVVHLMPYYGMFGNLDDPQIILLIATAFFILLIPISYRLLQSSYFRPLKQLVQVMAGIRDGKTDARMREDYKISEFNQFSGTFNEMMEQIKSLKIAAYEKELESQRAQLQYLQMQIRPHFFLNCLKNLYGMAQAGERTSIQELILALSAHFRHMFKDYFVTIPLSKELESIDNYIKLQQLSMSCDISCSIDGEEALMDFLVPPMSILTFVENSVKHGASARRPLAIQIKARLLCSEEEQFVNISISDNGKGFSEESLKKLNEIEQQKEQGENIGIVNVKRRLALIYNGRSIVSFSNNTVVSGACVEIFIPCHWKDRRQAMDSAG
jgi:two-component system sensor histidine kinase YesM